MARRELAELNLIDNFLFSAIAARGACGQRVLRIILETILGRDVKIKAVHTEEVILPVGLGFRGVRLDAYVEEERTGVSPGGFLDVEPDNKEWEKLLLPRRARFYHSRMDSRLLEVGKPFSDLPNAWVIFITPFDPFGMGSMVYTFKKKCVEYPDLEYDDGDTTIFLYTKGTGGRHTKALEELLRYMEDTTPANAANEDLMEIQSFVDDIKTDPEVKEAYMSMTDYIERERRDAAMEADRRAEEAEAAREVSDRRAEEAERERDAALSKVRELEELLRMSGGRLA